MDDIVVDALILDLLEWLATRDRSYEEVMEAWRTSCPRLPVWEEANDRGLVEREDAGGSSVVRVSSSGRELLAQNRTSRDARRDVPARAG
ncbi:MAG TPA: hypothetical protein VK703_04085 [Candidatus Acidoferrales bacterium]|jgi:D-3-phosphoglycerate dehydrogenase|nr:hypothetical protein [Candidatus Acidoferrales bacterium]